MSDCLSKDAILSANDKKLERVAVWGGYVFVRSMSGAERDLWEASIVGKSGNDRNYSNIRARLAVLTICDEKGERLFTDADAAALGEKSADDLDKVFTIAQRLNGLSESDVKALEGNS